jgi:hypothetical protein
MTAKVLTERRAADRTEMANGIAALVTECGATYDRLEGGAYPGPRAIQLYVQAARGLRVRVEFDGDSAQPDTHVLSWHMAVDADGELNDATFGGDVNRFHRQKATYIAFGFEELCNRLRFGLELAASGKAFLN